MKIRNEVLLLIVIIAFGAFLRFYNLGGPSMFNDELETVHMASSSSINELMNNHVIIDVHPPGFPLMMYYVVHYVGDTEFWLRFPSAIAGILSIFMIFVLGRFFYTEREGLIAAALTTVLWAPLYYSQEARTYSILFLLSMISVFYWLKIINNYNENNKVKASWAIYFVISAILLEYFQYLGLLLVMLQGLSSIIILWKQPKNMLKVLLLFALVAILFLPWLSYAFDQVGLGVAWIKKPKILAFGYFIGFLFNLSPYIIGIAFLLFLFLIYNLYKNGFNKEDFFMPKEIFLILWITIPFSIIFIKSMLSKPVLTYYSLIILAPTVYILLARAITTLRIKFKFQNIIAFLIFLIMMFQLIFDMNYYGNPYQGSITVFGKNFNKSTKEMFREAAQFVQKNDSKYPNSLMVSYAWFPFYYNYYFKQIGFDRRIDINVHNSKDTVNFNNNEKINNKDYIWIIRGHKKFDKAFFDYMANKFKLLHHETMIGTDVWLYKIKK